MSAYIVENQTIDRIITIIHNHFSNFAVVKICYPELGKYIENRDRLGTELLKMNIDAVSQRYNEKPVYPLYNYRTPQPVSKMQGLKSLKCYLYQCSEGDIPEKSLLYKELDKLSGDIAYNIVSKMKKYDAAEWR
jgi:hypothetical protein